MACTAVRPLIALTHLVALRCSHSRASPSHHCHASAWRPPRGRLRSHSHRFLAPVGLSPRFAPGWPRLCPGCKGPLHARCVRALGYGLDMQMLGYDTQGVLLMDVPAVAQALGFSVHQARRFLAAPPTDFPPPVRVGARIFVRRPQLEAWARGELVAAPPAPEGLSAAPLRAPTGRPRGRPRKSEVQKGRG